MDWKETIMSEGQCVPYHHTHFYSVGDHDRPIDIDEEVWDIDALKQAQAEISYKAGIKEVVEWVEANHKDLPTYVQIEGTDVKVAQRPSFYFLDSDWQAFKESKGVK